ncbi:MAG TPA: hypothetical protein VIK11_01100 [Tepidiformaceae bacterium]
MLGPFRSRATRRRVEQLIRAGCGVQEAAWTFESAEGDDGTLATAIEGWVREALGRTRRPNGINRVALALACRDRAGQVTCSNVTGLVSPATFYSGEGLAAISGFLADARAVPMAGRAEVICALVSLGDLVYQLDSARAA